MVVIQQELEKGVQVTDEIMIGRRQWKDLFTKHTFFTSGFRYYLSVITASRTKEKQNEWKGLVESKVRLLVNKLEMHPCIVLARPFNKGFDRAHRCKDNAQVEEVVSFGSLAYLYKPPAGEESVKPEPKSETKFEAKEEVKQEAKQEAKQDVKAEVGVTTNQEKTEVKSENGVQIKQEQPNDAQPPATVNTEPEPAADADGKISLQDIPEYKAEEPKDLEIYTTNYYIGLQVQLRDGEKSLDMSREVNDWKTMCMNTATYDEGLTFLAIQHVKNTALPDDVFEPGETKPRPVKKGVKRAAPEDAGHRQQQPPAKRQVPVQQRQQQQQPTSTTAAAAG
jgi:poly(A) polymerase